MMFLVQETLTNIILWVDLKTCCKNENWHFEYLIFLTFCFLKVEAKLIDKLDGLMSEGKGDETYRELFNNMWVLILS